MPKLPQKFIKAKPEVKKPKQKSPSNSRKNTEEISKSKQNFFSAIRKEWKVITVSFLAGMLGMAIVFAVYDVYQQLQILTLQEEKKIALIREAEMWEKIVASHPDYRDGYFKLALLQYQIGEREKARMNIEKTLQIDPNYEKARDFAKRLE